MVDAALKEQRRKAAKPLLWVGIASMAMAFAGLTSGYVVSRSALMESQAWLQFAIPNAFYYSTAIILLSSATVVMAVRSARAQSGQATLWLTVTLVLGLTFAALQYWGWNELVAQNIYFTGPESNTAGSWFYVITMFHMAHMAAGIISLIVTTVKSQMGKYSNGDILGVEMAAIFWHFLDILWIYLFLFLAIIR